MSDSGPPERRSIIVGGETDDVRIAVLQSTMSEVQGSIIRLEGRIDNLGDRIDGVETRLRAVEISIARVEGKIDALTETIVVLTNMLASKLPSWWQVPAAGAAMAALAMACLAGYQYLRVHGVL